MYPGVMTKVEIAWLAGLIEGEGCFLRKKRQRGVTFQPIVQIRMSDKDVIDRAAALMGGNVKPMRPSDKTTYPHKKQMWEVRVYDTKARTVMEAVYDLMGARRQAKIEDILYPP